MADWGLLTDDVLLPVLALLGTCILYYRGAKKRTESLRLFRMKPARQFKRTTLLAALALVFFVALFRPYSGTREVRLEQNSRDIVVLLDISLSMLANDIKPNRLEFAKRKIRDLVTEVRSSSQDRLGIILFAGDSFLLCPLTSDYSIINRFIETISVDSITSRGSSLTAGIENALLSVQSTQARNPQILLLTDGEDNYADESQLIDRLQEAGVPLDIIGIGTPAGRPIPTGPQGFLRDRAGNIVVSKLQEETLQSLAQKAGGIYQRGDLFNRDLKRILSHRGPTEPGGKTTIVQYDEIGPLLMWLALSIYAAYLLSQKSFVRTTSLSVVLLCGLLAGSVAHAADHSLYEASTAYEHGDYDTAGKILDDILKRDPDNAELLTTRGSVAFRRKQYQDARFFYEDAIAKAKTGRDAFEASYNAGNACLAIGDPDCAITHYEKALAIKKEDPQAEHNLAIAKELQRQASEQQESQQQDSSSDEDSEDQQDNSQSSDEQQQEQTHDPSQQEEQSNQQNSQDTAQDSQNGEEEESSSTKPSEQETEEQDREEQERQAQSDQSSDTGEELKHGSSQNPDEESETDATARDQQDSQGQSAQSEHNENAAADAASELSKHEAELWLESLPEAPLPLRWHSGKSKTGAQSW